MTHLARDILDATKIESGKFKLVRDKASIIALALESIRDIESNMSATKQLQVAFDNKLPAGDADEILIDKTRIGQVLTNILDNAINFTEEGEITVRVEKAAEGSVDMVQVSISDLGRGIDPSIQDKLFQKFMTKSDCANGTGLGLYLCKAIVEAHGGKIRGENNRTGRGATFTFTLPAL